MTPRVVGVRQHFIVLFARKSCGHLLESSGTYEGIAHLQVRETAEVAISRPQFGHAMLQTQCSDTGVVDSRSRHSTRGEYAAQRTPMVVGFSEHDECWRFKPCFDLRCDVQQGGRRRVDLWMRDDGEKLMQAGPRNRPRKLRLRDLPDDLESKVMPFTIGAVRINKQVGVDRNQRSPVP